MLSKGGGKQVMNDVLMMIVVGWLMNDKDGGNESSLPLSCEGVLVIFITMHEEQGYVITGCHKERGCELLYFLLARGISFPVMMPRHVKKIRFPLTHLCYFHPESMVASDISLLLVCYDDVGVRINLSS